MGYHGLDDGAGAEIGGNNRNFVSVDISWGACGASIRVNHWEKEGVGDGHGDPTRGRGVGGGWTRQVHVSVRCPQSSCAIVHCTLCTSIHNCASPSVTGISARGQSAGPWGSNYPPWLEDRCSLGAGLTRLPAQTNLVKDRDPSNDARWLCR